MHLIISLLLDAAIIMLLAMAIPDIKIKNYGTALAVAVVVALLNVLLGWLISFPLNLVTLFFLKFLVALVVTTIMIKLADKFFSGFDVKGWTPAFIIAVCLALATAALNYFWATN